MSRELKKVINVMPIVLFIIGRWIFDMGSPSISDYAEVTIIDFSSTITNWQVSYFIMLDIVFMFYLSTLLINENSSNYKWFYIILGFSFFIDAVINLNKTGLPFDKYIISTSSFEQNILVSGLMSAILFVFLIKIACFNQKSKKKRHV